LARDPKICVVTPSHWAAFIGGAEYQIRLLLDVLADGPAADLTYLARYVSNDFTDDRYLTRRIRSFARLSRLGFWPDSLFLLKMLKQERPDVIYQRIGCAYTGVCAAYARKYGARLVWHISIDNDLDAKMDRFLPVSRNLERWIRDYGIRRADSIVAQTHHQADVLRARFDKEAIVVKNFQPPAAQTGPKSELPTVVWIANLKPAKRPELFLEVVRETSSRLGIQFIMVGRGGEREPYATMISKATDSTSLTYLGPKTLSETNDLIASSHVFVNTSAVEGFPNTFIQAWLRKTAVVSLDVDPDGVLEKHKIGMVSRTPETLARTIEKLFSDDSMRETMIERAFDYATAEHGLENANRLASIILGK
jgi:glycosyltransferase involved in cell wall biosynthesis